MGAVALARRDPLRPVLPAGGLAVTGAIDSLMADGMRFDSFYANCPVCSPTRAALLSGTYPDLVGVPGVIRTHPENNWGWLSQKATLLPRTLKAAGYHTSLIGKWHLGLEEPNTPNGRGSIISKASSAT